MARAHRYLVTSEEGRTTGPSLCFRGLDAGGARDEGVRGAESDSTPSGGQGRGCTNLALDNPRGDLGSPGEGKAVPGSKFSGQAAGSYCMSQDKCASVLWAMAVSWSSVYPSVEQATLIRLTQPLTHLIN